MQRIIPNLVGSEKYLMLNTHFLQKKFAQNMQKITGIVQNTIDMNQKMRLYRYW